MKISKKIIIALTLIVSVITFSQETRVATKIKIGNYSYDSYYKFFNHYEVAEQGYELCYRRNGKEQSICAAIYFNNRSLLSISDITIDKRNKTITSMIKNLIKRTGFEADSSKYIYKQNKMGLFHTISVIDYKDGKEKVLFKK